MRAIRGYGSITSRSAAAGDTYHSLQFSFQRRFSNGVSFGFNDTIEPLDHRQHDAAAAAQRGRHVRRTAPIRRRPTSCSADNDPQSHSHEGQLRVGSAGPQERPSRRARGGRLRRQRLAAVRDLDGVDGRRVHRERRQLPERRRQREPHRVARLRRAHPHRRRSGRGLQQRHLPPVQHGGVPGAGRAQRRLESGNDYLRGCFPSVLDLSIARNIRLGGGRIVQLRVDMFNAPNQAGITGRNTTMSLSNPNDPVTLQNAPLHT